MRSRPGPAMLCALLVVGALLVLVACTGPPPLPLRDAARDAPRPSDAPLAPLAVREVVVRDARGAAWPPEAAPRAMVIEVRTTAPLVPTEPPPVLLLEGPADDALAADLARPPLTAASRARVRSASLVLEGDQARLTPDSAALPGTRWTVVVAPWARTSDGRTLGAPHVTALVVSSAVEAGAAVVGAFPADGTQEVPTDLARVVLALDGDVSVGEGALRVEHEGRGTIAGEVGLARCGPFGLEGHTCLTFVPSGSLPASSPIVVSTSAALRDATGAPVPSARLVLRTASGPDRAMPVIEPPAACALDEIAAPFGCVLADDVRVRVALAVSEPARVELSVPGRTVRSVAPSSRAELALDGLGPSARVAGTLALVDLADHRVEVPVSLGTTEPLAPIVIAEVCADPEGPEPDQEWIELENVGDREVPLEGLAIADRLDAVGTRIASSRVIPAGGRVILAGEGFDETRAGAPAGALVVRVGRTIVPSGLANAGEPLYLRDADGRRLAHVPALPAREGRCVVRAPGAGLRADRREDFLYDACSPGR
ncbi:MAG: hypothetical protein OHK0013_08010 [Sandaracinaceae bacterium]